MTMTLLQPEPNMHAVSDLEHKVFLLQLREKPLEHEIANPPCEGSATARTTNQHYSKAAKTK